MPVISNEDRPNNGRLTFIVLLKGGQEFRMRQIVRELKDTNGMTKHLGRNARMMEMQSIVKASGSIEVRRQQEATIDAAMAHGSMMLSLEHAQGPGLRNMHHVHCLKQVDKMGKVRVIKKTMAGVSNYLRWNEKRVFQRVWEKEDETALAFFLKCHPGHSDVC